MWKISSNQSSACSLYFNAPNSEEYLEAVKKTPYMTLEELKEFTLQYGDVYFHPVSPKLWILYYSIAVWYISRLFFWNES